MSTDLCKSDQNVAKDVFWYISGLDAFGESTFCVPHDQENSYISIISDQGQRLKKLGITYIAADAYFCKRTFMSAVVKMELHLMTRARPDADLKYLVYLINNCVILGLAPIPA